MPWHCPNRLGATTPSPLRPLDLLDVSLGKIADSCSRALRSVEASLWIWERAELTDTCSLGRWHLIPIS